MNFKNVLSEAIDNDIKIIITGRSGWGKSEMIQQVAEDKGLELIDFRLSEILPEDLVGIPKVKDDFYEYVPPKWLYDVLNNPDKKYLLFLDEITQGTPEVLNICYKIFDKVTKVGDHELPNVSVVGATNYKEESNYINELPEPLKKRACMLELDHNPDGAVSYLVKKYSIPKTDAIVQTLTDCVKQSNPRAVEKAWNLISNNASRHLIIPYIGMNYYRTLKSVVSDAKKPEGVSNISLARADLQNGFVKFGKDEYVIQQVEDLVYMYDLTPEEARVIEQEFMTSKLSDSPDLQRGVLTMWAAQNADLTSSQLRKISSCASFSMSKFVRKMKTTPAVLQELIDTIVDLMGVGSRKEVFKILIGDADRLLPINTMREFKDDLPWDLIKMQKRNGWLTEEKVREFRKELMD